MFERFTDRARRAVVAAQEEARGLKNDYIGTEHLLLGLLREDDGVAAKVLERLGIAGDDLRAGVERRVERGSETPIGHIPFTPRAKKTLELALREALQLGHNYIGTEHILLGLLREGQGIGAQVLAEAGADLDTCRQETVGLLGSMAPVTARAVGPEVPRGLATPAVIKVAGEARRLAQGARVGSQHYLLGLLAEERSMAAKVLSALGVTRESVEQKLAEIDPAGTTDETPEEAGARRTSLRAQGERLVAEVSDPDLAARLGGVSFTGTDPQARPAFVELYAALARTVDQLARRLPPTAPFTPADWDPAVHAASYTIVNGPTGPAGRLDTAPGVDAGAVRAWLRQWLVAAGPNLARPGGPHDETGLCSLWLRLVPAGDAFRVEGYGCSAAGPPGSVAVPMEELVAAAAADLAEAA